MTEETLTVRRPARARVLETASRLFYAEGVHAVGIDRIIAAAGVAKATFYHHFPSKDDLVKAYVTTQSAAHRAAISSVAAATPRETLTAIFTTLCDFGAAPGYRGCPYIYVAAEYPDPTHPVRRAVDEHRHWLRDHFRALLVADGDPAPDRTADILLLLRDGLSVGFDLDDPAAVRAATLDTLARVLGPANG